MYQFISRPAVYLVIGIGVLALLVSQFRSTDNQASTSVSELDPFTSLEDFSSRNLAKSTPGLESVAIPAKVNPVEMVRDELTLIKPYQQTAAAVLNSAPTDAYPIEDSTEAQAVDSPLQLANVDEVEPPAPVVNQIKAVDNSMTVLELDEPIVLDNEASIERYVLDEVSEAVTDAPEAIVDANEVIAETTEEIVEAIMPDVDPVALIEEPKADIQPVSAFEKSKAHASEENSVRPRGWRKNPFIVDAKPASEPAEVETSSNESSIELEGSDSFSINTDFSPEMNDDKVSTVSNFEPENAPSVVSVIPTTEQSTQSVMTNAHQISQSEPYNESLPIVIGLPDSVAHKAVHNIEYGKSLSRRGAAFAARQEFYSSLRILAQAHDTQAGGTAYTRALRDAIIALKEAEDFIVSDTETQIGLNVAAVVEGHSTKIIPVAEASNLTAIGAMQRYFGFASNRLRVASGQNAVAAEALYCLGKLHTVQAKFGANASKLDIAKAIVFHQAAIASDRTNFRSANELGVLMANSGRLQESQDMLKRSLQIQQLPQAWQNLAVVHQRAGQDQLAQLAQQEYLISSQQTNAGMAHSTIRWVEPGQFNQGTPLELRQSAAQPPAPQQNTGQPTISQRLRSLF